MLISEGTNRKIYIWRVYKQKDISEEGTRWCIIHNIRVNCVRVRLQNVLKFKRFPWMKLMSITSSGIWLDASKQQHKRPQCFSSVNYGYHTQSRLPNPMTATTPNHGYQTQSRLPHPITATTPNHGYQTQWRLPHPITATKPNHGYHTQSRLPNPITATTPNDGYHTQSRLPNPMTATKPNPNPITATKPNHGYQTQSQLLNPIMANKPNQVTVSPCLFLLKMATQIGQIQLTELCVLFIVVNVIGRVYFRHLTGD